MFPFDDVIMEGNRLIVQCVYKRSFNRKGILTPESPCPYWEKPFECAIWGNSFRDKSTLTHITLNRLDTISNPLFASADTGIYPYAASQYRARPKAKRGIAMLSLDKFPYPRKQTRCIQFIPCSNYICLIMKRFRSFKISDTPLIWLKSSYKHSVARSHRSGKESGRWSLQYPPNTLQ